MYKPSSSSFLYVHDTWHDALLQKLAEKSKDSRGGPWEFVALLPLFDPPRHDSAETIKKALNLGVNVKMITGTSFTF